MKVDDLSTLPNPVLLTALKRLVDDERKITLSLIAHLREVERRMLFAEHGYASLFEFAVKHLGLSEGSAHRRIAAMRLTRDLPEAKSSLESGALSLSNAARMQVALRTESKHKGAPVAQAQKRELLALVSGKSQKECETTLLEKLPSLSAPANQERSRLLTPERTEIRMVVSSETLQKLERLKELLAHRLPGANYTELLEHLATQAIEALEKKRGIVETPHPAAGQTEIVRSGDAHRAPSRGQIPAALRRAVWNQAEGTCEFPGCRSRYRLEIDHRIPLAQGGTHQPENLRLLCRIHNAFEARRLLGEMKMRKYLPALR